VTQYIDLTGRIDGDGRIVGIGSDILVDPAGAVIRNVMDSSIIIGAGKPPIFDISEILGSVRTDDETGTLVDVNARAGTRPDGPAADSFNVSPAP
jgi:hypothetical protein